ncbi:MAG: ImmA/IrrE family metallo-endopeptidase [Pirellulales bacterium]|nr:ImmA/IrrE family metallo-endopeptidase [Pirellulales bacterium]
MVRSSDALINAEMLIWARKSVGMSLQDAATRLHISEERLKSWESGQTVPTVKQLRKIAASYRQTFAAFYLSEPPPVFLAPMKDYRTLAIGGSGEMSFDLSVNVRDSLDRRTVFLEMLDDAKRSPKNFELQTTLHRNPELVGSEIRNAVELKDSNLPGWQNSRIALNWWRERIEAQGVLVFQSKIVQLTEMRGYSIAEFPVPVIVVNRKDAYAGRLFTLLHEFTHLMLRRSGLCDLEISSNRPRVEQRVEVFCNHVAGAALVPKTQLLDEVIVRSHKGAEWGDDELGELARDFGVSREVLLRRLLILGLTTQSFYVARRKHFLSEYENRTQKEGFVPPPTDVLSTSGKTYLSAIMDAYDNDRITSSDVSDYIGLKLKHLDTIAEMVGR